MRFGTALRSLLVFSTVLTLALAQQPQPPIRVQVNEVVVPVTVTNEQGKFVSDLEQGDFKVFDEGKEQTIRYFNRERNQRVVVGFLVDLSNQSRGQWKSLQEAATELVYNLLPGDKKYAGYLIGYGNEAELMVNTTSDADLIVDRLRKLSPSGGSAFYDALYIACTSRKLVDGEPVDPRRVIVVIGDGHDNASTHTLDQVIELAQRYQVTINAMSTDAYGFTSDYGKNLVRMAQETGGRVEYPLMNVYKDVSGFLSQPSDEGNYQLKVGTGGYTAAILGSIYKSIQNIAGEITVQYVLRYVPSDADESKVKRSVEVKVDIPGVIVRARTYYYPFSP
ncbi:MAG TPA: VWA domain-containing protein [Bryobacteraceae bacterium]|jgi:VWFA-related protein|nr:VWA domain-containing protein [Bryobacteraceae bacterium]